MSGRYDTGGSYQPMSPNFANFQVLASAPANPGVGRSYFNTTLGIGVYASGIWNYASGGGGGAVTSVFGRTGIVVAANGDYTFAQIGSLPTTTSGYGITDALTTSTTASGDLSGTYPSPVLLNSAVISKVLTGFSSSPGTISATDSVLSAFQKIVGNKGVVNGYASLDSSTKVPLTQLRGVVSQFNVKDYGAVGDGVTNDITAINACITAAIATGQKVSVIFPAGVYLVNAALTSITSALSIQGFGATIQATSGSFTFFTVGADNVDIIGINITGSTTQIGISINGFKFFNIVDCNLTAFLNAIYIVNTATSTFTGGNINNTSVYNSTLGLFTDVRGEYVSVTGGTFYNNTTAIKVAAGNVIFSGLNVNNNATGFQLITGTNNGHGIIGNCNMNHNTTPLNIDSNIVGYDINNCHIFSGNIVITNSANIIFNTCEISIINFTWSNTTLSRVQNCVIFATNGNNVVTDSGDDIAWSNNVEASGDPVLSIALGGRSHRVVPSGTTLDFSTGDIQYVSLGANVTVTSISNAILNKRYRIEVIPNGFTYTLIDNTQLGGYYNPNANINIFDLLCIDGGSDPRFIGTITQPGVLVSRPTTNIKWYNLLAAAGSAGTISGNSFTKTVGATTDWSVTAASDKSLLGNGWTQCQAATGNANVIFGLSTLVAMTNPATLSQINYGIFINGTNAIAIIESGGVVGGATSTWSNGDWFRVNLTGTTITYDKSTNSGGSWTTFYTSLVAANTLPLTPVGVVRALTTLTDARIVGNAVVNQLSASYGVKYASPIVPATQTILKTHVSVSSAASLTLDTTATAWVFTGSSSTTWTLPALAGNTDLSYFIKNRGSTTITLQRAGSDNLYTTASVTTLTINPGEGYQIINDGSFWIIL